MENEQAYLKSENSHFAKKCQEYEHVQNLQKDELLRLRAIEKSVLDNRNFEAEKASTQKNENLEETKRLKKCLTYQNSQISDFLFDTMHNDVKRILRDKD